MVYTSQARGIDSCTLVSWLNEIETLPMARLRASTCHRARGHYSTHNPTPLVEWRVK